MVGRQFRQHEVNITGQRFYEVFDVPDARNLGGVAVGMEIYFEHPKGLFTLEQVGARFDEVY